MRPPRGHRATTAHLQSLYPFVFDGGLAHHGPMIGRDVLGGAFCFDPWELYRLGRLTNPNVLVVGQIGRGKSTFVKTLVWRQLAFGREAWIIDPKGEYAPLANACGAMPIVLRPGGPVRLNPLEIPGEIEITDVGDLARRRSDLVASILCCSLGRPLAPFERTALDLAVHQVTGRCRGAVLGDVVEALFDPDPFLARSVRSNPASLAADGRTVALELRRMVHGDLAGMFDAPTTPGLTAGAPVIALDLSETFSTPALPLVMTCAIAWLQAACGREAVSTSGEEAPSGGPAVPKRLVVLDEAWAVLSDLAVARWAQASFKLARARGVCNVVVVHRISDLRAAGSDGSAEQKVADGLLADSETRVVFGQPPSEAALTAQMLRLTATETELISKLPRGWALWKVGDRSFVVEHLVAASERALVDTDTAMTEMPRQAGIGDV